MNNDAKYDYMQSNRKKFLDSVSKLNNVSEDLMKMVDGCKEDYMNVASVLLGLRIAVDEVTGRINEAIERYTQE